MHYLVFILIIYIFPLLALADKIKEKNVIYIYKDEGVSNNSILHTVFTLKETLTDGYYIHSINAKEIIRNEWVKDAALLIVPGGADLPYTKKLNGQGNANIKNYVNNGGSYLGICAGSYYASAYVEFDKSGELEVLGERELAFFPGPAVGPIIAKYSYENNSGARAANIRLGLKNLKQSTIYYNGGGYFKDAANYSNVVIMGYYQNHLPAIVHILHKKGNVILSGVHFEYSPCLLDKHDPYLNKLYPDLKHSNTARIVLAKTIFKKLGLTICK